MRILTLSSAIIISTFQNGRESQWQKMCESTWPHKRRHKQCRKRRRKQRRRDNEASILFSFCRLQCLRISRADSTRLRQLHLLSFVSLGRRSADRIWTLSLQRNFEHL